MYGKVQYSYCIRYRWQKRKRDPWGNSHTRPKKAPYIPALPLKYLSYLLPTLMATNGSKLPILGLTAIHQGVQLAVCMFCSCYVIASTVAVAR